MTDAVYNSHEQCMQPIIKINMKMSTVTVNDHLQTLIETKSTKIKSEIKSIGVQL